MEGASSEGEKEGKAVDRCTCLRHSGARARLRSHIAPAAARARAQLDLVNTRSGKRLYMQSVWMVHLSDHITLKSGNVTNLE